MELKARRPRTSKAALIGGLVLITYLAMSSLAITQWLGYRFEHQPILGARGLFGLYAPWKWLAWTWLYYRAAPTLFGVAALCFAISGLAGVFVYAFLVGHYQRNLKAYDGVHGTAHWATETEIEDSGLLPRAVGWPKRARPKGEGVYCGAFEDEAGNLHYLRHNGPEHVALIAPTRSGKGVSNVVPTLLSYPASVVVNDQKGELWEMTAGWRREGANNVVLKFDPASASGSVGLNPLAEVRLGTLHEIGDVQNLVTIIVDPDGKGMADHWAKTAHAFLTGVVLHLGYQKRAEDQIASLADVARAITDPDRPIEALYKEMLENAHLKNFRHPAFLVDANGEAPASHPTIAAAARQMLDKPANERGSVLSTAQSFLTLYQDPLVARNVSNSDFRISDLMDHERPVSLYLVVRAEDKDRMKPLMRLIINLIVRVLLRPELKFKNGRAIPPHTHKLLLMLDEFPSYGRLEVFQEALAYIAGYGIKAMLIMQDIPQLHQSYSRDESILSNCHVRIAFAPNKIETGEWISKNLGVTTVMTKETSVSGSRFGAFQQNSSTSIREVQRPLLTADETMRLKSAVKDNGDAIVEAGEVIVMVSGHPAARCKQSLYFLDKTFVRRSSINAPSTSDSIRSTPNAAAGVASAATAAATASQRSGRARSITAPIVEKAFSLDR